MAVEFPSRSSDEQMLEPDQQKVDVLIARAVSTLSFLGSSHFLNFVSAALLDNLDNELSTYSMRCREWYGWHFPELGRIIPDKVLYARAVILLGNSAHLMRFVLSSFFLVSR
jgi:hypothetical protein